MASAPTDFTPWASVIGGALIGLSAVLVMLFFGRIARISGILGGLLQPTRGEVGWRAAFLFGLVLAPFVYRIVGGTLPAVAIALRSWARVARAVMASAACPADFSFQVDAGVQPTSPSRVVRHIRIQSRI